MPRSFDVISFPLILAALIPGILLGEAFPGYGSAALFLLIPSMAILLFRFFALRYMALSVPVVTFASDT